MERDNKQLQYFKVLLIICFALLCFCTNKSRKEASFLYSEAIVLFEKGEYDSTILNLSNALEIINDNDSVFKNSLDFYNGNIYHLRGEAFEALNKLDEATSDYVNASIRGTLYINSEDVTQDNPKISESELAGTVSGFYNSLGKIYYKAGKYEDALAEFEKAIAIALGIKSGLDLNDKLIENYYKSEPAADQPMTKVVGAYCYNFCLIEEKLERRTNSRDIIKKLSFDRTLAIISPDSVELFLRHESELNKEIPLDSGVFMQVTRLRTWKSYNPDMPPDVPYQHWLTLPSQNREESQITVQPFVGEYQVYSKGIFWELLLWFENKGNKKTTCEVYKDDESGIDVHLFLSDGSETVLSGFKVPGLGLISDESLIVSTNGKWSVDLKPGEKSWIIVVFDVPSDQKSAKFRLKSYTHLWVTLPGAD